MSKIVFLEYNHILYSFKDFELENYNSSQGIKESSWETNKEEYISSREEEKIIDDKNEYIFLTDNPKSSIIDFLNSKINPKIFEITDEELFKVFNFIFSDNKRFNIYFKNEKQGIDFIKNKNIKVISSGEYKNIYILYNSMLKFNLKNINSKIENPIVFNKETVKSNIENNSFEVKVEPKIEKLNPIKTMRQGLVIEKLKDYIKRRKNEDK